MKLSNLLTAAVVTGLLAAQVAHADETTTTTKTEKTTKSKHCCKDSADGGKSCKAEKTGKKHDCKNGCKEGKGDHKDKADAPAAAADAPAATPSH